MTTNLSVNEILKPFHGVLNALASRQPAQTQVGNDVAVAEPTSSKPSIRKMTTREFHLWDRLKETIKSPENITSEVQNLAATLAPQVKVEIAEPLPDSQQLAKNRAALARAKTTHSRLKSLEAHLNKGQLPTRP
jgi:hypothetical protein